MKYILLLLLLIIGCKEQVPSYQQETFADVTDAAYMKCTIGDIEYYTYGVFVYHNNNMEANVVYTPKGEYLKPKDYPRWQYRLFLNKEDSIFVKIKSYIEEGMPNGEKIECQEAVFIPSEFTGFIKTHEFLYKDFQKEAIEFE